MGTTRELASLFRAIANRDWQAAVAEAEQLATAEERTGHHQAAARLRGALRPNGRATHEAAGSPAPQQLAGPITDALTLVSTPVRLDDVRLRPRQRRQLANVVLEWTHRARLEGAGLRRTSKLLLHGPPGCGKSLSARALAAEIGLPAYVVRFDAIVGAYLGQTALRIRELFRFAEAIPSVLVLDEVDALGRARGNPQDVAELDRVVVSLMQQLELVEPRGLVVAASNLPRTLDPALLRRFDLVVDYPSPSARDLASFARTIAEGRGLRRDAVPAATLRAARSYADVTRAVDDAARSALLREA
jgi:SpoVK/Ycf46/Vps4 family AAA+-type ATPase